MASSRSSAAGASPARSPCWRRARAELSHSPLLFLAALALVGCAGPSTALPPTPPTSAALPARLGDPQLIRAEGTVEYRRYRVGPCQLDLFLQDTPGGAAMVAWLDARPAREVDPALGAACADLAARLRGRSTDMPLVQALSEPL